MKYRPLLSAALALACAGSALAAERVPGTWTYYSPSVDPITDVNTGLVIIDEINDRTGQTNLAFKCANGSDAVLWSMLSSKNPLVDGSGLNRPTLTVRVGSGTPQTVYSDSVYTTTLFGEVDTDTVGLPEGITREMAAGLFRGDKVVIRVERAPSVGSQTLTYTFPADGFKVAWNAVNRCQQGRAAGSRPAAPASTSASGSRSSEAPKFTQWYFTACTDTQSGAVRSQLRAGQTHRCQLVIETIPNGARPVSATFSYELEYVQGGRTQKLTLPGGDRWSEGQLDDRVLFRASGSDLVFNLPLNVRSRTDRRYTSINVTGNVKFSNGSSKKIYEKLPVVP